MADLLQNWARTVAFTPAEVPEPRDVEEVQAIVRRARATGRTVRVLGSMHSWSPVMATEAEEAMCRALDGRPHWGKLPAWSPGDLLRLYPKGAEFLALRARFDPDGVFGSPAIDRLLVG